jgi:hypothetical protein
MKISATHSHFGGLEWLQMHHPDNWSLFQDCLGCHSNEHSPEQLWKAAIHTLSTRFTWTQATVELDSLSFMGICLERFGLSITNTVPKHYEPPFYADHLANYVADKIEVGIEILPMKSMQAQMSSGPGYYEGALYNLIRQGRGVPAVPLVLIGLEP